MSSRAILVERGLHLEYLTLAWNCVEAAVALIAGLMAGSIALVSFGLDSVIEVSSGAVLVWRLRADHVHDERERVERLALRLVGMSFLALAVYVTWESAESLYRRESPLRSVPGIVLGVLSLIVMPWLARAKRQAAVQLNSGSLRADSRQTEICAYLSAIMLAGLVLNAVFGWWWADPLAGLLMAPIILKEAVEALRGRACACQVPGREEQKPVVSS